MKNFLHLTVAVLTAMMSTVSAVAMEVTVNPTTGDNNIVMLVVGVMAAAAVVLVVVLLLTRNRK